MQTVENLNPVLYAAENWARAAIAPRTGPSLVAERVLHMGVPLRKSCFIHAQDIDVTTESARSCSLVVGRDGVEGDVILGGDDAVQAGRAAAACGLPFVLACR